MAGSGSNTLRAVLKELGWSRTRLVAELRRQAARSGDTLPATESVIAMVSRWVNNHQQPSDFYRDLLARTLGRPRAELFSDEAARLELAAEAEPWLLARALEASSVGPGRPGGAGAGGRGVRPLLPEYGPDRPRASGPGALPGRHPASGRSAAGGPGAYELLRAVRAEAQQP